MARFYRTRPRALALLLHVTLVGLAAEGAAAGADVDHAAGDPGDGWIALFEEAPTASWVPAGDAELDPADPGALTAAAGRGVLISTRRGSKQERNLRTARRFADVELRFDFMLARGSNAGVKMHGLYELQLFDSHGVASPDATHSGGIYPRAVREPSYHHIDAGTPPLTNAAKPAGQWQSVYVRFRAPRFGADGQKAAPAVFDEVRINGLVVQENAPVDLPTGAYWGLPETPTGPIYLQGDHGPVAYRNVRARAIGSASERPPADTPEARSPPAEPPE